MKIKFIPSQNKNDFCKNKDLLRLVDLSLEHFENHIFDDILTLISTSNISVINLLFNKFKSNQDFQEDKIYEELQVLINSIYSTFERDNLRGSFLEILIFKLLDNKYDFLKKGYLNGIDGYIEINGIRSERTVDVFAMCEFLKGFVCECKINAQGFEDHDIRNLNNIFTDSHEILSPYIVSLSPKSHIDKKLSKLYSNDSSNAYVHGGFIEIISIDDFVKFFN